jgi:hypothetical protein
MAWIEVHQSVASHKKTLALADYLDIPEYAAVGLMTCFWLWAVDSVEEGRFSIPPRQIARAIRWEGEAAKLVDAMIDAGFLERDGEYLVIVNWYEYIGKLIDQRKSNADRQKRFREQKKTTPGNNRNVTPPLTEPSLPENGDVTVTSPSRNAATRPDPTVPYQTDDSSAVDTARVEPGNGPKARSSESSSVEVDVGGETLALTPAVAQALGENPHWAEHLASDLQRAEKRIPRDARSRRSAYAEAIVANWREGDGTPLPPTKKLPEGSESSLERDRVAAARTVQAPASNALPVPPDWVPGGDEDEVRACARRAVAELRSEEKITVPTAHAMGSPTMVALIRERVRVIWREAHPGDYAPWEMAPPPGMEGGPPGHVMGRPPGPTPKKQTAREAVAP